MKELSMVFNVEVISTENDESELLDKLHNRVYFTLDDSNLEQAKIAMLESVTLLQNKIARLSLPKEGK